MSGLLLWASIGPKENSKSLLSHSRRIGGAKRGLKHCSKFDISFTSGISGVLSAVAEPSRSSEERVYEVVLKQAALVREQRKIAKRGLDLVKPIEGDSTNEALLNDAYDRCGEVCAEYAKTFYLGTFSLSDFN